MTILPISDPAALDLATEAIHQRPILVQFPSVFVLMAAPTSKGVSQLDATKKRLSGKNYGTAIGRLEKFITQAQPGSLPHEFTCGEHFTALTGSFIRLQFDQKTFQSKTIRNGTHQGLLLDGIYGSMFRRMEESFASSSSERMWNHRTYSAPLCTSCNLSGDPDGSITDYDKAYCFAKTRGIDLFITATQFADGKGSYPIFGFESDKVTIHREGPGLDAFKERIPPRLRSWEVAISY
ncbi:hypothetical protein [Spirosoma linguale]|uniref:Uncharacterized protein n=1 Tax=Spirosoma linguale (strain ATCC 33905 / DSM 74 / LMG 10896 / Claus 1) TaxID=504472 RepID=D2QIR9_SPILD|nr:hypothetical protein Slin_4005 [Spirosoma linguale DSM 74]